MSLALMRKYFMVFALSVSSLAVAQSTPTITRDSYGVPTIQGGDFAGICRAVGQVYGQDRLWQMFEVNVIANGRAAQYISPEFLSTDIFERQINPTDAEVQEQIDKYFTEDRKSPSQTMYKGLTISLTKSTQYPHHACRITRFGFWPRQSST